MILYLQKLFKTWIFYLAFIPWIYDLISAYFHFHFRFPSFLTFVFAIGSFLFATYAVYNDEYKKRRSLEEKLNEPTDYKISAILTVINFQKEKLFEYFTEQRKIAENELSHFPLKSIEEEDSEEDKFTIYKRKLIKYLEDLKVYEEYIDQTIESLSSKYYFVDFFIQNIGTISDSNIEIEILCKGDNVIFNKEDDMFDDEINLFKISPKLPTLNIFQFNQTIFDMPNIARINLPNLYRSNIEINKKTCFVKLRELNVGAGTNIFDEVIMFKKESMNDFFEVIIKSKESRKILKPKIEIKYDENTRALLDEDELESIFKV